MPADKSSKRKAKRDPDEEDDNDEEFEIKPKLKKSESDADDSEEDVKPKKKTKRESPETAKLEAETESEHEPAQRAGPPQPSRGEVGDELIDEDGRPYFLVSDKKRVTLSEFKGKQYVNIREYYIDKADGKEKPGKKGITLDMTQWDLFKTKIGTVDGWIGSSGKGKGKGRKK